MILPGQIYMADIDGAGAHPVVVVSREELNRGRYALVVPCTSSRFTVRSKLPNCVPFRPGEFGFTAECVAQCENVFSIDKDHLGLPSGPFGKLDAPSFRKIVKAIGHVIQAECEPR